MADLKVLTEHLPERHRNALEWFDRHAGTTQSWPAPLDDGTLLATKAKGIYKPQWSQYALSIRHALDSPYKNISILNGPGGSWFYSYYQESPDPQDRDQSFTNRGLMACLQDQVPIGVLVQVSGKPNVKYHVQGLGLITHWEDGYFYLQSIQNDYSLPEYKPQAQIALITANTERESTFDPANIQDGREKIVASITRRRGQGSFRKKLIQAYDGKCAVTGCELTAILEAAHIIPYMGKDTNHVANGLLLRSDIHTLFDLGLLSIDPSNFAILLSPIIESDGVYGLLKGSKIRLPHKPSDQPSAIALKNHYEWSGLGSS